MAVAANEEELQLILSLDDTDVDKDDQASPSIWQSTNSFTVNELISVLVDTLVTISTLKNVFLNSIAFTIKLNCREPP